MAAVSQNGGCVHWHWPLEDGKKRKHFSIQCSPISTTALIFGGSHALSFVLLVRAACR